MHTFCRLYGFYPSQASLHEKPKKSAFEHEISPKLHILEKINDSDIKTDKMMLVAKAPQTQKNKTVIVCFLSTGKFCAFVDTKIIDV